MADLFGQEVQTFNVKAYPAPPGTGPPGETCGTCSNSHYHKPSKKRFWKCKLIYMTHGEGTDIKVRSPSCRHWTPKAEPPNA